jgi:hypothetical protein
MRNRLARFAGIVVVPDCRDIHISSSEADVPAVASMFSGVLTLLNWFPDSLLPVELADNKIPVPTLFMLLPIIVLLIPLGPADIPVGPVGPALVP